MGYEELNQSVISDEEMQLSGDVETSFVEFRELSGAPPVAIDKATSRLYVLASDGKMYLKDSTGAVLNISAGVLGGGDARDTKEDGPQSVAATATTRVFRAVTDGTIESFAAETGDVAAAGESMDLDIQIDGVSALVSPVTIDDSILTATPVDGVIDTGANTYVAGDLIEIVRTYVAGVGPTPMTNTIATVAFKTA